MNIRIVEDSSLEAVNALAREFGYGQGELDDDLAGCLRRSINGLRRKTIEEFAVFVETYHERVYVLAEEQHILELVAVDIRKQGELLA